MIAIFRLCHHFRITAWTVYYIQKVDSQTYFLHIASCYLAQLWIFLTVLMHTITIIYLQIFRKHSSHDSPKTKQLQLVKASLFLEMRISYQNVCFCLCLHEFPPLSFHSIPLVASWWKTQHSHKSQQTNCIRDCRFSPTQKASIQISLTREILKCRWTLQFTA